MTASIQRDAAAYQGSCTNLDFASVENSAVEVDKDIVTHLDVRTIVDVNGRLDPSILGEEVLVGFLVVCWWWQRSFVANDANSRSEWVYTKSFNG